MKQKIIAHNIWIFILLITSIAGVAMVGLALLPYDRIKPLADLLAGDGSLDLLTYSLQQRARPFLLILGVFLLVLSGFVYRIRQPIQDHAKALTSYPLRDSLHKDFRELITSLHMLSQDKVFLYALLLITLLGGVIRGLYLTQPMQHDEAYTYTAFASRALRNIVTDYHLPNNHVFHTILVFISTRLLGNFPWTVRLPAYIAGVLLIPASYLAGRLHYDKKIALTGAALVAVSPVLIAYSANARGYTLLSLVTLVIVILAVYLKVHHNLIAWSLFTLLTCLGFYTLPIMLYPFGMVFTWLLISAIYRDIASEYRRRFFYYLFVSTVIILFLSLVLYAPIFLVSGFRAVISNEYVQSMEYSNLWDSLLSRIVSVSEQWLGGSPAIIGIISLLGIALGLILHRRISAHRVPLQIAALLGIGVLLVFQRVAPLARIWLFLLPLFILWASAGIIGGVRMFLPDSRHRLATNILLLAALLLPVIRLAMSSATIASTASLGVEEEIALYMKDKLRPGDLVVIQAPIATPLEYYFMRYGLPLEAFDEQRGDIQRLLVVVSSKYDQTLDEALAKKGPADYSQMDSVKIIHQYKHATIYELSP